MQTPFHIYVQRNDLSLVMALAAFGVGFFLYIHVIL